MFFAELSTFGSNRPTASTAETLCTNCGLCCNGVIFADVKLQPGDQPAKLQALGLSLVPVQNSDGRTSPRSPGFQKAVSPSSGFFQPCTAFDGCKCRIYADRPRYCREFECLLFKKVEIGHTSPRAALEIIRQARERSDDVRMFLRQLEDNDEHLPLAARFSRTSARLEAIPLDPRMAEVYGRLTLVFHDLNLLLAESFFPG